MKTRFNKSKRVYKNKGRQNKKKYSKKNKSMITKNTNSKTMKNNKNKFIKRSKRVYKIKGGEGICNSGEYVLNSVNNFLNPARKNEINILTNSSNTTATSINDNSTETTATSSINDNSTETLSKKKVIVTPEESTCDNINHLFINITWLTIQDINVTPENFYLIRDPFIIIKIKQQNVSIFPNSFMYSDYKNLYTSFQIDIFKITCETNNIQVSNNISFKYYLYIRKDDNKIKIYQLDGGRLTQFNDIANEFIIMYFHF